MAIRSQTLYYLRFSPIFADNILNDNYSVRSAI